MKVTRLTVALVALLVAGAVIVGGLAWRARRLPPADAVGVTLLVNRGAGVQVTPGTPLYFQISVAGSPASGAVTIGSRWRPWHRLIRLEASGRDGMPWVLSNAGPARSLHVIRTEAGRPEIKTELEPSPGARLDGGRHVYTVTEVAAPEATAQVGPGAFRVRAVLETPWWLVWGWRGRVVSQPVTVVVRSPTPSGETRDALELRRLAQAADFYVATERFEDAERMARQLVERGPKQAVAHRLLGDALLGLKRRDEALVAYRRAMVLLPPSYEKPTLLMDRIQFAIDGARR